MIAQLVVAAVSDRRRRSEIHATIYVALYKIQNAIGVASGICPPLALSNYAPTR
jgi:hypothetical protein